MHTERRAWVREKIVLALVMDDGASARTRDVSPGGVYIYFPCPVCLGDLLAIDVTQAHARIRFRAVTEIVRLEVAAPLFGAALKFHSHRLLPQESVA